MSKSKVHKMDPIDWDSPFGDEVGEEFLRDLGHTVANKLLQWIERPAGRNGIPGYVYVAHFVFSRFPPEKMLGLELMRPYLVLLFELRCYLRRDATELLRLRCSKVHGLFRRWITRINKVLEE